MPELRRRVGSAPCPRGRQACALSGFVETRCETGRLRGLIHAARRQGVKASFWRSCRLAQARAHAALVAFQQLRVRKCRQYLSKRLCFLWCAFCWWFCHVPIYSRRRRILDEPKRSCGFNKSRRPLHIWMANAGEVGRRVSKRKSSCYDVRKNPEHSPENCIDFKNRTLRPEAFEHQTRLWVRIPALISHDPGNHLVAAEAPG